MSECNTVIALLQRGADTDIAIVAPGRASLTYGGLRTHVARVVDALNALGIGRNDRVALALPNGPEMAATFVGIAAGATVAPLNPAYRAREIEWYLSDLHAQALVVAAGEHSPAGDVAARLGLAVIELRVPDGAPAGIFELSALTRSRRSIDGPNRGAAHPDDVALVLHTSGTTSRAKMVPLTQRNVSASAGHIRETLALTPADRCLNIMPLFHIHGLMAAVLASLGAGASVACTPGFDAFKFFGWMRDLRPTWYTAVPSLHQAILDRAARNAEIIDACRLRLIRSSSASLPPRVMAALEGAFDAPVIESYGMTEAAHQMASNPLPPRPRKPGSVGLAAGPEVAVMDAAGTLLGPGQTGEVVIRGPNVMDGYENNPQANAAAFTGGWLRTGDQGRFDADGYLSITGRLKEIINRGGEKISPREIDEVLLEHPAVAQAVTFATPHDRLGEDVAAAVVLRRGASAEAQEIRAFAATRLADFKVPRQLIILDEIPQGATGKPQRVGLAAKLGLTR